MLLDGPGQDMMRKAVADAADVSTEHRGLLAFVGDGDVAAAGGMKAAHPQRDSGYCRGTLQGNLKIVLASYMSHYAVASGAGGS